MCREGLLGRRTPYVAQRSATGGRSTDTTVHTGSQHGTTQPNATLRPWGYDGPTPDLAFGTRTPITAEERKAFLDECERQESLERAAAGWGPEEVLDGTTRRTVGRAAIRRALCRIGYLRIRRRRVGPRISGSKSSIIR
jgi:hypothetical protein